MTNNTVLSDAQIFDIFDCHCAETREVVNTYELHAVVRAAEQALLQSPEIQQRLWQPIETAPKDGTRYIGAYRYEEVWFAEVVGDHSVSTSAGKLFPATHWMPLPKPPIDAAMEVKP